MIRINLLPAEFAVARKKKEQQLLLGSIATVFVLILSVFWMLQSRKSAALDGKISEAETELRKYQAIVAQIDQIESDKRRLTSKRDVIRNLNRTRLVYPVFFEDLLPLIPSEVWISNLTISEQGGGMRLTMPASALSNFALAQWLTNLQQSPHISGVELSAINYAKVDQSTILSFVITCNYQHRGPFPLAEN